MTPSQEIDYILPDCFLALGQAVGTDKGLDFDTVVWWHTRYRAAFMHAMTTKGNSWTGDRRRVTAVGRYLGLQAKAHAVISLSSTSLRPRRRRPKSSKVVR